MDQNNNNERNEGLINSTNTQSLQNPNDLETNFPPPQPEIPVERPPEALIGPNAENDGRRLRIQGQNNINIGMQNAVFGFRVNLDQIRNERYDETK